MSTGRLVINGKTWGEFEAAKRIKGHIVISGYESYGGCHTVRGIKQPVLNENQQIVLDWLKTNVEQDNVSPMCAVFFLGEWQTRIGSKELRSVDISYCRLTPKQQAEVLQAFSQWAIEQEEK